MPATPSLKTQSEINSEFNAKLEKWNAQSKGVSEKEKNQMKLCGDCASICASKKSKDMTSISKCGIDNKFVDFNRSCVNGHFKVR